MAISMLIIMTGTWIFTTMALCVFEPKEGSYFLGFLNSFITALQASSVLS
jgi:hypothetical protein